MFRGSDCHGVVVKNAGLAFNGDVARAIGKATTRVVSDNDDNDDETKSGCYLEVFNLSGAYVLKDSELAGLISVNRTTLASLTMETISLLSNLSIGSIMKLTALIELSLEHCNLGTDQLLALVSPDGKTGITTNLKSLNLAHIPALDDKTLATILTKAKPSLQHLDLSGSLITDASLSVIRRINSEKGGGLRSLSFNGMKGLTSAGLEVFFSPKDAFGSKGEDDHDDEVVEVGYPPQLTKVDLGSCLNDCENDRVIELCAIASDRRGVGQGLVTANFAGGGSKVGDRGMEALVGRCCLSLVELDVSFCHKVSDKGLGYLCEKSERLKKLEIWGCAQISDDFLEGHGREGLRVEGVWMRGAKGAG